MHNDGGWGGRDSAFECVIQQCWENALSSDGKREILRLIMFLSLSVSFYVPPPVSQCYSVWILE